MIFNPLLLQLAFRNLWRNHIRTGMVVLMIASSLVFLIFFNGFMDGMLSKMTNDTIRAETSDITIYKTGYRADQSLSNLISNPVELQRHLQQMEGVSKVALRLRHDGMAASAYYSQGVRVFGVDSDREKGAFILSERIKEGSYGFPKANTIWLGTELADKLRVNIGRKVVLTLQDYSGEIVSEAFRLGAILRTNNPLIDQMGAFISLEKAQSLLGVEQRVSQLSVSVASAHHLVDVKTQIQSQLGAGVEVFTWRQLFSSLQFMDNMMDSYNKISYIIIFVIIAIGIVGVILMTVLERIREFGILLAIGHRFYQISIILLWESALMGFFGFLLGILGGYTVLLWFRVSGIDMAQFASGLAQFGLPTMIYPQIKLYYMMWALACVSSTSFLSVLWPLWILYKRKPIQSIQFT